MFQMVEFLLVSPFLWPPDGRCYYDAGSGVMGQGAPISTREPQCQVPTAHPFISVLQQKDRVYLGCCLVSILLTVFLREAHSGFHIDQQF